VVVIVRQEILLARQLAQLDDDAFANEWERQTSSTRRALSEELLSLKRRLEDPTPGSLAKRLDSMTVQTSALDLIDAHMIQVRDAIQVMYDRRHRYAELMHQGVSDDVAIEQSAREIASRGIQRMMLSMPPQEGKSERITVVGVLWLLRQFPMLRVGIVSYDGEKASEFSRKIRNYIETFDGSNGVMDLGLRLMKDQKALSRFSIVTGGSVYAIGIGGGLTGRALDLLVIDDPVKDMRAADSILLSYQAWDWWQTVARPRLAPGAPVIEVATRWSELDLGGRFIAKQKEDEKQGAKNYDKWVVINIPAQAEYDSNAGESDILGRDVGEFMVSARGRTRAQWETTKQATANRLWYALFQGKPTPDVGDVLMKEWWRRYDELLVTQQVDGTFRINGGWQLSQSWDFTFKDKKTSDFVVGGLWARKGADSYLIYVVRARLSFTASIDAMRRMTRLFPQAKKKYVEVKANGDAIVDTLRHEIAGIIEVTPDQSKTTRAIAVSPFVRSGNFYIPTIAVATSFQEIAWSPDDFIYECTSFPNGQNDDQVDMFSQYAKMEYIEKYGGVMLSPVNTTKKSKINAGQSEMAKRIAKKGSTS
jgi:predicted phage terminase large subunit-like protein